jgi:hypothetical protein
MEDKRRRNRQISCRANAPRELGEPQPLFMYFHQRSHAQPRNQVSETRQQAQKRHDPNQDRDVQFSRKGVDPEAEERLH